MTRRLCILFITLLCLPLAAQQTYRARVVDAETGEALPYVTVSIDEFLKLISEEIKNKTYFTAEEK